MPQSRYKLQEITKPLAFVNVRLYLCESSDPLVEFCFGGQLTNVEALIRTRTRRAQLFTLNGLRENTRRRLSASTTDKSTQARLEAIRQIQAG